MYSEIGDIFGWLALLFGIALSGLTLRRKRIEDDDDEDELDAPGNT